MAFKMKKASASKMPSIPKVPKVAAPKAPTISVPTNKKKKDGVKPLKVVKGSIAPKPLKGPATPKSAAGRKGAMGATSGY